VQEVGTGAADEPVGSLPAEDGVRTRRSGEPVCGPRAHDRLRRRCSGEEHDGDCDRRNGAHVFNVDVSGRPRVCTITAGERVSRLGQAIAEGDGISVIAHVISLDEAREAAAQGADALAVSQEIPGLRETTPLPILWRGEPDWETARKTGADAYVVFEDEPSTADLELVAYVVNEEQLADALEYADPEIFMLGVAPASIWDAGRAFQTVLDLLHDVPAGKLAIAELRGGTAEDVAELERAGVDAVLVTAADVAALVPVEPPEV
jgi:hypothetical protein